MKWVLRIFAVLVGLLVVCVVVLLGMGMRADAGRMQSAAVIKSSPGKLWPWLYEPDKVKTWVSWLKDVQSDPGFPVTGAKTVWTMEDANNGGAQMKIYATAEAVEANRRLTLKLSTPGAFHGTATYMLSDLGGGATKLETDSRYEFEGWFPRLMTPLIIASARSKFAGDINRLRASVENR
jgi:hypothetical protein